MRLLFGKLIRFGSISDQSKLHAAFIILCSLYDRGHRHGGCAFFAHQVHAEKYRRPRRAAAVNKYIYDRGRHDGDCAGIRSARFAISGNDLILYLSQLPVSGGLGLNIRRNNKEKADGGYGADDERYVRHDEGDVGSDGSRQDGRRNEKQNGGKDEFLRGFDLKKK